MANEDDLTVWTEAAEINLNQLTGTELSSLVSGLGHLYPNPFNSGILIEYHVNGENQHVQIDIFDQSGRKISSLIDKHMSPGTYKVEWLPASEIDEVMEGLYILRLRTGDRQWMRKIMYMK